MGVTHGVEQQGIEVVRGRYEAYVTPSNFLGEAAIYAEGTPTIGTIPDHEHDDVADIESAYRGLRTGHSKDVGLDGMSGRERREIAVFERRESLARQRYLELLEQGYDSEQARIIAAGS